MKLTALLLLSVGFLSGCMIDPYYEEPVYRTHHHRTHYAPPQVSTSQAPAESFQAVERPASYSE